MLATRQFFDFSLSVGRFFKPSRTDWKSVLLIMAASALVQPLCAADEPVSYYEQIRPIFQANCQGCHQPAKPKGEYVMTAFDKLLGAGESGDAAIVPGKPDESYLVELIMPVDGEAEMPKEKAPLAATDVALIRRWIEQGAKDDTPASAIVRYDADNPPVYTLPPVITSLDYSPDGKLLAATGFHEVLLYSADGSNLVARLVGMSARIQSVKFSPDGKWLAVTGGLQARMGEVQVWNVEKRELALSVPVTYDTVYGANWSPDGRLISFGCGDNTVRAIEAKTGKQVLYQGAHNGWPLDTVFSAKGTHLISVGEDRTAKLTEVETQRFIDNITSITPGALVGGVNGVDRHPTKDEILVGGADGTPKLYRVFRQSKRVIGDDANLIRKFPPLKGRIFDVAISRDGKRIAAGSSLDGSGEVRIYAYEFDTKIPGDLLGIMRKRSYQRSAEEKEKLANYRKQGVKMLAETAIDDAGIYAVAFSTDGKRLAAAGSDGMVRLINSDTGSVERAFSPIPPESMTDMAAMNAGKARKDQPWRATAETERQTLPKEHKIAAIEVQPTEATINSKYDVIQFLVTAQLESGDLLDVTRMADASVSSGVVEISSRGLARAIADGRDEVTFTLAGRSAKAIVDVTDTEGEFHPYFIHDVMPAISKIGCNTGTCHGANKGKGSLRLSLRGNDPIYDARTFSDDLASRRVNRSSPDNSLMLLKAVAGVPHEAGQVMRPGEPYYEIIRKWIGDGAKIDLDSPRVTSIDISPKNPIAQRIGDKQQFRVLATYTDGSIRDVTQEANIQSGNTEAAEIDSVGLVTTVRRGESPMLARFEGKYAATTLTVMGDRTGFAWKQLPVNNFIDELVDAKLQRTKTLPSDLCSDAEFIRRVYLDLIGLPPTVDEIRKFLADDRDARIKRDAVIDRLVGSDDYIEHWTNKWADLLQVNRKFLGVEGSVAFRKWIRDEIAANTPYDQFVHKILAATGSNKANPPASYFKILRTPTDTMENTTHLFLGVRFSCNKCHDHPFERWSQDQYYETAAYFAQYELKKDPASGKRTVAGTAVEGAKPLFEIVADKNQGEVTHDRTGAITAPKLPFVAKYDASKNAPRREHIARWITSPDNGYFAKSYVNRMWGYLLGLGLIEPLDDIRAGNPPTNAALLDRLTTEFIDSKFDVRRLVRTICKSRTYQLSIATNQWNEDDKINYSHANARRLPAEVLYDTIHRVTGSQTKLPGVPAGTRAAELPDAGAKLPDGFLATFGRPPRESACECERSSGMLFGPVMALVSGPTLDNAINDRNNELAKLAASEIDDERLVDELFIRILGRPAMQRETEVGLSLIRELPGDHEKLVAALKAHEVSLQPIIAEQEQKRQANIELAKAELAAYEKEIAPREAELDRKRQQQIAGADAALKNYEATSAERLAAWEAKKDKGMVWTPLDPAEISSTSAATLTKQKDLSILATSSNGLGAYKVVAHTELSGITAVKLDVLTDDKLPKRGPGRAPTDGNFVLTEFELSAAPKSDPGKATKIGLENAQADFSQNGYHVKTAIDGKVAASANGWAIAPKFGVDHRACFETKQGVGHEGGTILTFTLKQQFQSGQHSIGRFRLSVTTSPDPILLDGLPKNITDILAVAADQRNDKQRAELMKYYRGIDGQLKKLQTELASARKPRPVDPKLKTLRDKLAEASKPLPVDSQLAQLRGDVELSKKQLANTRLTAAQDIAWALMNSPAFLFNR